MNLGSLTGTLTKNSDKIGLLAGVFGVSGINGVIDNITKAASGNIHVPDLTVLSYYLGTPYFKNGVMAAVGGYIIDEFAPGEFKKYGKVLSDFGVGYIEGTLAWHLLAAATNADRGSDPTKASYNPNWMRQPASVKENFVSAPLAPGYY